MNEQFTTDDARAESANNYTGYRDAFGRRDQLTRKKEAADSLARTLFKQLNERHLLIRSGLPTSPEDAQNAALKQQKAFQAEETAGRADFDAIVAGMDVQEASDKAAYNYRADPAEYHAAALESAAEAGVSINR